MNAGSVQAGEWGEEYRWAEVPASVSVEVLRSLPYVWELSLSGLCYYNVNECILLISQWKSGTR